MTNEKERAMREWHAEVTVSGVPAVSVEDLLAMQEVLHGVVGHRDETQEMTMMWYFACESDTITSAIEHASFMWRAAIGNAPGVGVLIPEVACKDFRVRHAMPKAEAKAELDRMLDSDS